MTMKSKGWRAVGLLLVSFLCPGRVQAREFVDMSAGSACGWTADSRYFIFTEGRKDGTSADSLEQVVAFDVLTSNRVPIGSSDSRCGLQNIESGSAVGELKQNAQPALAPARPYSAGGTGWKVLAEVSDGFGRWMQSRFWYDHGREGEIWAGRARLRAGIAIDERRDWYISRVDESDMYSFGKTSMWVFASPSNEHLAWLFVTKPYCDMTECHPGSIDVRSTPIGGPLIMIASQRGQQEAELARLLPLLRSVGFVPSAMSVASNQERKETEVFFAKGYRLEAQKVARAIGVVDSTVARITWSTAAHVVIAPARNAGAGG